MYAATPAQSRFVPGCPSPQAGAQPERVNTMDFAVSARQSGTATIIDVSGPVMYGEAMALDEMLRGLIKVGQKNILLNLGDVTQLDSSGIGVLVRSYLSVKKSGGALKVMHLSKQVQRILEVTRLSELLEDYPDEDAALKSF
jgi:anti-sigma B factor antagonist